MGTLTSLVLSLTQLSLLALAKELTPDIGRIPSFPASVHGPSPGSAFRMDPLAEKKWKEMAVWGKRFGDAHLDKKWKEMSVWGKRNSDLNAKLRDFYPELGLDKKWKEMSVWGKRTPELDLDKKWKEMSVWGKRTPELDLDKKWKEMSVWGKRFADPALEKRWKEMSVWGKRNGDLDMDKKWKEMSVWGKRFDDPTLEKKWKEMSVWGKRTIDPELPKSLRMQIFAKQAQHTKQLSENTDGSEPLVEDSVSDDGSNQESEWASSNAELESGADSNKELDKKWREMAVWGKRNVNTLSQDALEQLASGLKKKRGTVPTSEQETWARVRQRIAQMSRKRPSWSDTGFNSWGKRADGMAAAGPHISS